MTALLIGSVSGVLLRTWWSVVAVPLVPLAAVTSALLLHDRPATADNGDLTAAGAVAIGVVLLALIALGAALGTVLGKRLHGDDRVEI